MQREGILELIWRGAIKPANSTGAGKFARIFRALVPVLTVSLFAERGIDRAAVLLDEDEVMPLLPLGDVLVEELSIDVPYGALVVVREATTEEDELDMSHQSYQLGFVLGETLLIIVRAGVIPMQKENTALYAMASSFDQLIEASGFQHEGVRPGAFRLGMAASLGAYWSGARDARSETSGLFDRADFLQQPELITYLRNLDAGFAHSRPGETPAGLMLMSGGVRGYPEWLQEVTRALNGIKVNSEAPDSADQSLRRT